MGEKHPLFFILTCLYEFNLLLSLCPLRSSPVSPPDFG